MKLGRFLKSKHFGIPSRFDIYVILFILILPYFRMGAVNRTLARSMLLIYTSIFFMCVRLHKPGRREFYNQPLALLAIWGLFNIFYHSYFPLLNSQGTDFCVAWGNWSLLNEGYIYILCGAYLISSIVKYAKNWGWYYIPLLVHLGTYICMTGFNMAGLAKVYWQELEDGTRVRLEADVGWSMTVIFAVVFALGFTLIKKTKKWWLLIPSALAGLGIAVYKWEHVFTKLKSRPDFWKFTIDRIRISKFWLGHGYYHTMNTRQGLVASDKGSGLADKETATYIIEKWGRGWRQSDLLEFGEYMGVVGMILVIWLFGWLLWKGKAGLAYFFVLTGTLMCLVQRTMFFPDKAMWILIALSLLILETKYGMAKASSV